MDERTTKSRQDWPDTIEAPQRGRQRDRRAYAVIAVALVVLAGLAWWFRESPSERTPGGRRNLPLPPVATAPVQSGDIDITIRALGTVTPLAMVTVRTQISGQLVQVGFEEGQTVNKGDLIAQIDDRPYQLALAQAQGTLKRDQALLENSKLDLERYQKLAAANAIPRQQLDTQTFTVRQNEANVIADQAQIDTQKLNIAYCHIIAPITGKVGLRLIDPGNYVTPSDTNGLVVITQIEPISVIFTVPEDNLPAIRKRLQAGATLPVTAFDRSGNTKLSTGKLLTTDNQIDTSTGTLRLRAQFDNHDGGLFPNQFVNIELLVDTLKDTPVVSTAAIQRGAPGTFVYLVNADSTVSVRAVKLGPSTADRVAVQSGLAPGDKVVIDGADKLRDGAKVVEADPATNEAPATPNNRSEGRRRSRPDAPR
jgi:membrane fusion protein, multidrug efflux system